MGSTQDRAYDWYFRPMELKKIQYFANYLVSSEWLVNATEKIVDDLLEFSFEIQLSFVLNEENSVSFLENLYPGIDFKKSSKFLMGKILSFPILSDQAVLFALRKYISRTSKDQLRELLHSLEGECAFRWNLDELVSQALCEDPVGNLGKIDELLAQLTTVGIKEDDYVIVNNIKVEMSLYINQVQRFSIVSGEASLKKFIEFLDNQPDLKLFIIFIKSETFPTAAELCVQYSDLLNCILRNFDRIGDMIETVGENEMRRRYRHLSIDVFDLMIVFKLLLVERPLAGTLCRYVRTKVAEAERQGLGESQMFWKDLLAYVRNCDNYEE